MRPQEKDTVVVVQHNGAEPSPEIGVKRGQVSGMAVAMRYGIWGYSTIAYYTQNWQNISLISLLFPLLIWILLKLSLVLRWILYWAVTAAGLLVIVQQNKIDSDSNNVAKIIVIGFVIIEAITLLVYLYTRVLYVKTLAYLTKGNPDRYFQIRNHPKKDHHYIFKGFLELSRRKKVFSYVGEVDEHGIPHGFGKWTSKWAFGEVLTGYFEHGKPVGPFTSREYKTGYAFKNLRIGFASTTATFSQNTLKRADAVKFGVASVECSIAGRFFSDLPKAKLLFSPFGDETSVKPSLQSMEEVLRNLRPVLSKIDPISKKLVGTTKVTVEYSHDVGFSVPGFMPPNQEHRECNTLSLSRSALSLPNDTDHLVIDGWKKRDLGKEAVVFVPGFNSTLEQSLETFGQMIALGNLSSEMKPIVFNWPGGSLIQFSYAVTLAKGEQIRKDLIDTIQQLRLSGITRIHLLCHSLVMNASADFAMVFRPQEELPTNADIPSSSDELAELASLTLLNPEAELDQFKAINLPCIRQFTRLITVYSNKDDVALKTSEYINWKKMLGCRVYELYQEDGESEEKVFLDIDVIDTSELDTNIQGAKHSYFNLNKVNGRVY
ncbi:hypothetical protein HDV03_001800 [Kappamyces sp. JEL0829]|nr:hypothetical protein HDV03_001800 [Kappamyces sp. JEL0829]